MTADSTVYQQIVERFGTVAVRPVDPPRDAGLLHGWVTQDRARFWGMLDASQDRVQEIYEYVDSLSTHHAYLTYRDDDPVALFQTYEPDADPVGECYHVQPGDCGIHLLIGPPNGPTERGYTATLVSAFLAYVLAEPSRQRIVVEPDVRNGRAIARLARLGFVPGPEIDLPEKRAQLMFLDRPRSNATTSPAGLRPSGAQASGTRHEGAR